MIQRRVAVILATCLLPCAAAGCGEGDDGAGSPIDFEGVYRPKNAGAIGAIAFSDGKNYFLMPDVCRGRGCTEIGTYRLDVAGGRLTLRDAATAKTRTLRIRVDGMRGGHAHPLFATASGLRSQAGLTTGNGGHLVDEHGHLVAVAESNGLTNDTGGTGGLTALAGSLIQAASMWMGGGGGQDGDEGGGQDVYREEDDEPLEPPEKAPKEAAKEAPQKAPGEPTEPSVEHPPAADPNAENANAGAQEPAAQEGDTTGAAVAPMPAAEGEPPASQNPDNAAARRPECKNFPNPDTAVDEVAAYWKKCPTGLR